MVIIRWKNPFKRVAGCFSKLPNLLTMYKLKLYLMMSQIAYVFCCLTYNEHMSYNYVVDLLMEPIHWFVNNFAMCLGKVFVVCISFLTAAVVIIAYWVGLPYWWERDPYVTVFLVAFGNWLLVNIVFHYYMGVTTPPGYPPHDTHILDAAGLCKKCIMPKPQRTHHCSVCDRCILAMDHHCPWLNNCVGYFNARYFYLYMVYMLAGVTFIIIAGLDLGYQVMWVNDTGVLLPNNDPDLIGHPVRINQTGAMIPIKEFVEYDAYNSPREHDLPVPPVTESQRVCAHPWKRRAVYFMASTCVGVAIALTALTTLHGRHISRGETSVESLVNTRTRATTRLFKHPYDFGRRKNWKIFLGLTQGRTVIRHVLFPSAHGPMGDGVFWHSGSSIMRLDEQWP